MENKMNVLILGGTGAMGKNLVAHLKERGFRVFVTSRTEHKSGDAQISYIKGNARDIGFLRELLNEKWDAIVDFMAYSTEEFASRVYDLLGATPQYVFISSARVYAPSDRPLTENSPRLLDVCTDKEYLKTDEYALSKARQEDMLLASDKTNYTIIRPSLTYDDNRLQFAINEKEEWLYRAMHGRSIIFPEDMQTVVTTMTWGYDVARAIARMIGNEQARGETVQITAPCALTWSNVLDVYKGVLTDKIGGMKVFVAPDSMEIAHDLGRTYQIKYARRISRTFDCSKLEQIIGKMDFVPPEEGLANCLNKFFEKKAPFHAIDNHVQLYFDKLAGERATRSEFSSMKKYTLYLIRRYAPQWVMGILRAYKKRLRK